MLKEVPLRWAVQVQKQLYYSSVLILLFNVILTQLLLS